MNRREMEKFVIEKAIEIQKLSGREVPEDINEKTVPIGELAGFDSLNGLELSMMLPEEIGWSGKNVCASDDGKKALSFGEIVERLMETHNPSD